MERYASKCRASGIEFMYEVTAFEGEHVFVVLEISKKEARGRFRFIKRTVNMLKSPRMYLESAECRGGHFVLLRVEASSSGEPDWKTVERVCGPFADRVLFPDGIGPPDDCRISRPYLPRFNGEVAMRTACEIIDRTKLPLYKRALGLVDFGAAHTGMLGTLLRHFTSVNVVTSNPGPYEAEALRMMNELGAPVIISSELGCLRDCVMVLSPSAVLTGQEPGFTCPVIAASTFVCSGHINLISELTVSPEKNLTDACPASISPHEFAGALFEFCGIHTAPFFAKNIRYNNKHSNIEDVVRAIICGVGLKPENLSQQE